MPSDTPPIVLCFGLADPTGASGVQADIATLSSVGCHGTTVLTGYMVRDSANCEAVTGLDPETVAAQARALLEDMPVAAFKVGAATCAETIAAIAEVAADYDSIPLILAPDFSIANDSILSIEALRESVAQLLVPQTTVLVADCADLIQLEQPDNDADAPALADAIRNLLSQGCEYVMSGALSTHNNVQQLTYSLYNEQGVLLQNSWERSPLHILGNNDTLATALAALLANGLELADAVHEAQEYLQQTNLNAFRPGMGAYLPDRFFWAKTEDEEAEKVLAPNSSPPKGKEALT